MPIKYIFNKDKKILRTLITNLKAQDVKMATLGPVLSAYDLNIHNICKGLNESTKHFPKGMNISITLIIYIDKTFSIDINGPSTTFLLKQYKNGRKISLINLWKVYLIRSLYETRYNFRELISTVLSCKLKII